jgi:hypothetical protein
MDDPLLGLLTYDDALDGWVSTARPIPFLGGRRCRFVMQGYAEDPRPDELRAAVENALNAESSILSAAEPQLREYREDILRFYPEAEGRLLRTEGRGAIWSQVRFGNDFCVSRRAEGDSEDGIYLSLECECEWEVEHGLQLVLRDGRRISKLGPFDGHVTNSDACADRALAGVVYRKLK